MLGLVELMRPILAGELGSAPARCDADEAGAHRAERPEGDGPVGIRDRVDDLDLDAASRINGIEGKTVADGDARAVADVRALADLGEPTRDGRGGSKDVERLPC